ncbi:MAG TPA: hypothetical protein VK021_08670 [Flavobacteriaceae bacterium]|nr:hypothetical protein [Flavobacteriaceae bacterium]
MNQNKFIFFLIVLICLGCTDSKNKNSSTSITGEIFNPRSDAIVLLENNRTIDTVMLDENNRFYYKFDEDIKDGLYTFLHNYQTHYETQMFYLEKGDSLQFRLNTQEFDQSLMYSGEGAVANNFLMMLFLENIQNNKLLLEYYRIEPEEFLSKADSIKADYKNYLSKLHRDGQVSKNFKKLANQVIDYSYYDIKERYYFLVNKYMYEIKRELPADFMNHRKSADFNHEELQKYYIYQHFLDDYLKNKAVEHCQESGGKNCFDLHSKINLQKRLELADSLFKLKSLRQRFMRDFSGWLIVNSETEEAVDSTLTFLSKVDFDQNEFKRINRLAEVQKRQFIGHIGDLSVTTKKGDQVKISSLTDKPTVFYYWSLYYKSHHLNQHEKIKQYQKRYPEVNFVGINIDYNNDDGKSNWQSSIENFGYDGFSEYQLICPANQRIFYRNYLNKAVFVDTSGVVLTGKLNLRDNKFEEKLLGLLNRENKVADKRN